jgi:hypothetical protein
MIDGPVTEALRLQSPDALRAGLLRLLIDGEHDWLKDWRDLMVAMAPYHDCATRLGLDPAAFFDDVAREAPQALADTVRTFGQRTDITPSAFGFTLTTSQDGMAYEWPDVDYDEIRELEEWLSGGGETSEP